MKFHLYPGRDIPADWNNPEICGKGLLDPHAYFIPFPDAESCASAISGNRRYLSPWVEILNGKWDFRMYNDVLQLPENILSIRSGFLEIEVPGKGLNIADTFVKEEEVDFPLVFPYVPVRQPVLLYRKKFHLPLRWSGLRKKLVIMGISSAAHVFCNGKAVGYTEGSMITPEFDLTNSLVEGENELVILVWARSTSTYLELSAGSQNPGIHGDIYLEAYPSIFMHNLAISTVPDGEEGSWKLEADVNILSCRIARESPRLRISVLRDGISLSETLWQVPLQAVSQGEEYTRPVQTTGKLKVSIPLQGIEAWSCENPVLYDLYISVEEKSGQELMTVHKMAGFRFLEEKEGIFLLNGKPLKLLCAEWSPSEYLGIPEMVHNLRLLRRNNLNSIYIRNFAADPILLELCDIYGVYAISEVPVDISKDLLPDFCRSSDVRKTAVEKICRYVHRDLCNPSVVAWSAGIFRHAGQEADFLDEKIREIDSTRLIHIRDLPDLLADFNSSSSPVCVSGRESWLSYPEDKTSPGRCYGCWFDIGRRNALPVLLDKNNKPSLLLGELRHILCPLLIKDIDAADGAFMAINRQNFLPASCFRVSWIITRDGKFTLSGEIDNIRMKPGGEQFIEIWYGDQEFSDEADYILRFEIQHAAARIWSAFGSEAGICEFVISRKKQKVSLTGRERIGRLRMENDRHHVIVSGPRFWMVFNRLEASLESWRSGEKEMLANPVQFPSGLRPFIDFQTDFSRSNPDLPMQHVISREQGCDGQSALIEFVSSWGYKGKLPIIKSISRYDIDAQGRLMLYSSFEYSGEKFQENRFGLYIVLAKGLQKIAWAGKGPQPGLPGLHLAGKTGIYRENIADLPYDNSDRGIYSNCSWLNIYDDHGFGISISTEGNFSFSPEPLWTKRLAGHDERPNLAIRCYPGHDFDDGPERFMFEIKTAIVT